MSEELQIPLGGGTLTLYNIAFLDPVKAAINTTIAKATAGALNRIFQGAGYGAAQQEFISFLQRTRPEQVASAINPDVLALGPLIGPGYVDPRGVDLGALTAFTASIPGQIGGIDYGGELDTVLRLVQQSQQRSAFGLASLGVGAGSATQNGVGTAGASRLRSPFYSLQAGPIIPCSADDPAGRCLTPVTRALQQSIVLRTLQ